MKSLLSVSVAFGLVVGALAADELAFNLDFWYFNNTVGKPDRVSRDWAEAFHSEDFGRFAADEKGVIAFADDVLRGAVTRFVMNVNAQRSNVDSKAFEPVWKNGIREGMPEHGFVKVSKSFHDRGIDPYRVWTRRCREKGVEPWISVRMNDMHKADLEGCPSISDWWRMHREFRRYPDSVPDNVWFWESQCLDFAHEEVRNRILAYIDECLGKYDVDGVELDWTRFPWVFAPGKERENAPLLTGLVRKVRRTADAYAQKRGHPILISCRMVACPETELALGLDVDVWARERLFDIADVGNHWHTADYEIPIKRWRETLGRKVKIVPHIDCGLAFDWGDKRFGRRLLSQEEYLGWVDVMRVRGCDDVSLFNLFGHDSRSPEWNETLKRGFDRDATAGLPRRYPLSHRDWGVTGADTAEYPQLLPCVLDRDFAFSLPVGTVSGSDRAELILGFGDDHGTLPEAKVNDVAIPAFKSRSEDGCRGFSSAVPASVLISGRNRIRLSACGGRKLVYAAIRIVPCRARSLPDYADRIRLVDGKEVWTDALQAAIDANPVVEIPARSEKYYIDAPVVIPSHRRIEATGATVRLLDGTRTLMLRNASAKDGTLAPITGLRDQCIEIVGGRWEDCCTNRCGYGRSGMFNLLPRKTGNFFGVSTLFYFGNVDNVIVKDATFVNCGAFAIQAGDGRNHCYENIVFENCFADGLHLNGNLEGVCVKDVRGSVGDDLVALNAYDWLNSSVNFGPQRDVVCEDLDLLPSNGRVYPAIRIQPAVYRYTDGTIVDCSVDGIVFRRVKGITTFKMYLQTPRYEIGTEPEWSRVGSGGSILFEDIKIDLKEPIDNICQYRDSDPVRGHFGAFEIGANIRSVTLRNVDVTFHADRWPQSHLVTVGPKSATYEDKGRRYEIFDPYVSCAVEELRTEGLIVRGVEPSTLVKEIGFDNINGDGHSSGFGKVGALGLTRGRSL